MHGELPMAIFAPTTTIRSVLTGAFLAAGGWNVAQWSKPIAAVSSLAGQPAVQNVVRSATNAGMECAAGLVDSYKGQWDAGRTLAVMAMVVAVWAVCIALCLAAVCACIVWRSRAARQHDEARLRNRVMSLARMAWELDNATALQEQQTADNMGIPVAQLRNWHRGWNTTMAGPML